MRRALPLTCLCVALLVLNTGWGRKKEKFELDKAKLSAVKRVAVFSVYGPARHAEGMKEKIDLQPFADAAEQTIVAALAHSGFEVIPLDETRAAFKRQYADAFADAVAASSRRGGRREADRLREQLRSSGIEHQSGGITGAKASRNTSFVFGTDEPSWMWRLSYSLDGHPVLDDGDPKAEHADAAIQALAKIATSLDADAYVIARIRPTTAGSTGKNQSAAREMNRALNPFAAVRDSVKTLKSGEWGAAIVDFGMFDRNGATVFDDQVIERSEKEVGNVTTGLRVAHGIGESAATPLMKEALDKAVRVAFQHMTGKDLPSDLPGMGVEAIAQSRAAAADAARAAAEEAPARMAAAAGTYELATVAGKPLPYRNERGFRYDRGTLELKNDGTFTASTVVDGRSATYTGTYTITGAEIAFKVEGNALVRMSGPNKGEVAPDAIVTTPGQLRYTRLR